LNEQKKDTFSSLNCIQIGQIVDFDAAKQTASIQLLLKKVVAVDPQGIETYQERPTIILKCPVITLFGGTAFISLPIQPNDNCIVLFNDREIDNWFVNGGTQVPTTARMHDVSDAIAIVGVRSLQDSIATYLTNGIRLSYGGGTAKIDLQANAINSLATMFLHTGNMKITGTLEVEDNTTLDKNLEVKQDTLVDGGLTVIGEVRGNGGTINIADNVVQAAGKTFSAGNGATGTFNVVYVSGGIVTGGY
jgi:hypothetical protein